jgi:hypothetical protein
VSKVCIYPLVSVTTSFVAEEDAIICNQVDEDKMRDLEKALPPPGAEVSSPLESRKLHFVQLVLMTCVSLFLCQYFVQYQCLMARSVSVLNGN